MRLRYVKHNTYPDEIEVLHFVFIQKVPNTSSKILEWKTTDRFRNRMTDEENDSYIPLKTIPKSLN